MVRKSMAFPHAEEDANGGQKEPAKKPSLEPAAELRKPKSPPPVTVAKKQKPRSEDASRPKGAAPTNGTMPPATLPKPSVSAEFMLQARRPKVPAVGESGDEAGDDVKGKGTYLYICLGTVLWDFSLSNLRLIFQVELIYSPLLWPEGGRW